MLVFLLITLIIVLSTAYDIILKVHGPGSSADNEIKIKWLCFSIYIRQPVTIPFSGRESEEAVKLSDKDFSVKNVDINDISKYRKQVEKISFSKVLKTYRQLRSPAFRFLKAFSRSFRVPYAKASLLFGFKDPSYTGIACGYAYAVKGYIDRYHNNLVFEIDPDFVDEVFDLEIAGKLRIRPYRFIFPFIQFFLDREVLHFCWERFVFHCKKRFHKSHTDHSMC